jgi:hypothetical protein
MHLKYSTYEFFNMQNIELHKNSAFFYEKTSNELQQGHYVEFCNTKT